jgi:hypothetical protein
VVERERRQQRRLAVLLRDQHQRLDDAVEVVGEQPPLEVLKRERPALLQGQRLAEAGEGR